MIKIENKEVIDKYILKHGINEIIPKYIKPYMELLLFKKNEHICKEGEEIKYLFFFIEGKAKVYITLSNGKSLLLCFYQDFKILGDLEMLNSERASTNVQVIEDTYCIGITIERVRKFLLNDAQFLRYICNSLGEKLNRCSKNSSINLLYPLENRLASYLLATGDNFDENFMELSEMLGTSYRHLHRTINNLCLRGVIRKEVDGFQIIDKEALIKLAVDLYI